MPLEQIIQNKRKGTKKPKPVAAPQQRAKPNPAANARNKKTKTPQNKGAKTASDVNVAKSVGAGKANRNAQINARRGLAKNTTPTKADVKKEVNKQLAGTGGLKISFKPGELNKTTEKAVSAQIKAVLSRQVVATGGRGGGSPGGSVKSAVSKSSNGSGNGQRRNPKARAKNTILRINR